MTRSKRINTLLLNKTAIAIIEEEAGKPILNIPKDELLERVGGLSAIDFYFEGLNIDPGHLKQRYVKLISEGKFLDYVKRIKKPRKIEKPSKYQPSLEFKRRPKYYIKAGILTKSESRLMKTQIMYRNNLSYRQTVQYLDELLRLNLLVKKKDIYKTTDLGLDFNYVFQQLRKFLSGKKTDELAKLDRKSKQLAISALHGIKRKMIYDDCALILQTASKPIIKDRLRRATVQNPDKMNGYIEFLTGLKFLERVENTNSFKTTPLGSQYLEAYLHFILYNYLG